MQTGGEPIQIGKARRQTRQLVRVQTQRFDLLFERVDQRRHRVVIVLRAIGLRAQPEDLLLGQIEQLRILTSVRTIAQLRDLATRSEEHTSELQSLMRISYAVFCLKQKKNHIQYIQ